MCGQFSLVKDAKDLEKRFGVIVNETKHKKQTQNKPTQNLTVVKQNHYGIADFMRWGLLPDWELELKNSTHLINIRAENLKEKNTFRKLLQSKRCMVPADGFYEWKTIGKNKTPIHFHVSDNEIFTMAGLWNNWIDNNGVAHLTFGIITTLPNLLVAKVHNRMPVIINQINESTWLHSTDVSEVLELLNTYPANEMYADPNPDTIQDNSLKMSLFD